MDSLGLLAAFRDDVDDNATPYLWSDASIAAYADDAQKMFCRLTNGIADSTSSVCVISIDTGEPFAALDRRILKIRRMQRDSDARQIKIVNVEDMDTMGVRLDTKAAPITVAVLGMEDHKIRWGAIPAVDDTASMTVFRLPLRAITTTKSTLEIDEQHHRPLLLWMKYLAYGKQDSDVYDARAVQSNEAAFRAYCTDAKREQDRARHKVRIVAYGGL